MKLENDLGRDPIRKLVLNIAIPSMLAQFVSVLYSIVDRIYIGNIPEIGNLALAGAGVCGPVVTMIGSVAFLVGVGGSPLMSIRMGEGNLAQARKILANCFLLLNVLAVLLMAGALLTRRPLLLLFGASETTLPYALDYYTYYLFGTVFALLANGMNQFVICQGFAKKGMQSVMLGAVLNIALDPVFIFGLNMGVRGAAIATVISQLGSCLFVLHFLFGPVPQVRITFGGYSRKIISRVLLTGLAPFLIIALDNLMIIALNAVLQNYGGPEQGDMLVAAATIAQSFMLIITMPMAGITGSTGSILGYNFGAGRPDRILEAQKYILALCLAFTTVLFLVGQFLCAPLYPHFHSRPPGVRSGGPGHQDMHHWPHPTGLPVHLNRRVHRHGDDAVVSAPVSAPQGRVLHRPVPAASSLWRYRRFLRGDGVRPVSAPGHHGGLLEAAELDYPGGG